jgi:hypothetical protein
MRTVTCAASTSKNRRRFPLDSSNGTSPQIARHLLAAAKALGPADDHAHGPTLSSTQMLPDSCAVVNTSLSWVSESPTKGMHLGIINRGLSNFVT